ncbi:hypothetical protein HK102_000190 [Quaeritorhiza haematococci]|nr:hypothetical protein HK102_000190 [Quaeritorhiza haematococci]
MTKFCDFIKCKTACICGKLGKTPSYTTVAVFGAFGTVGPHIVRALLDSNQFATVKLISRKGGKRIDSLADEFTKKGAQFVELNNAEDHNELVQAFKGIQVVIMAIGGFNMLEVQTRYINAAKEAGVKRIYPTEFGIESAKHTGHPVMKMKADTFEVLKKSGLEYTIVSTGLFTEFFPWLISLDKSAKTALIQGTGDESISTTPLAVIGQVVAQSINKPESKNSTVFTPVGSITIKEAIALAEEVVGDKISVTYVDPVKTIEEKPESMDAFAAFVTSRCYLETSHLSRYDVKVGSVEEEIKKVFSA